jgi:hypothetical protein
MTALLWTLSLSAGLGLDSGRGAGPGLDPVPQRLVVHGEQRVDGEIQCGPQVVAQR